MCLLGGISHAMPFWINLNRTGEPRCFADGNIYQPMMEKVCINIVPLVLFDSIYDDSMVS